MREGEVVVTGCVFRVELDGALIASERGGKITSGLQRGAKIHVGGGVAVVRYNSLAEMLKCLRRVVVFFGGNPAVHEPMRQPTIAICGRRFRWAAPQHMPDPVAHHSGTI